MAMLITPKAITKMAKMAILAILAILAIMSTIVMANGNFSMAIRGITNSSTKGTRHQVKKIKASFVVERCWKILLTAGQEHEGNNNCLLAEMSPLWGTITLVGNMGKFNTFRNC